MNQGVGVGEPPAGDLYHQLMSRIRAASPGVRNRDRPGVPAPALRINFLDFLRGDHLQDESIQ
jgi:hypothetical protein